METLKFVAVGFMIGWLIGVGINLLIAMVKGVKQ